MVLLNYLLYVVVFSCSVDASYMYGSVYNWNTTTVSFAMLEWESATENTSLPTYVMVTPKVRVRKPH